MAKLIPGRYKEKSFSYTPATTLWHAFGFNKITRARAEERIENGELSDAPNLMMGSSRGSSAGPIPSKFPLDRQRSHVIPVKTIDQVLIDAIENQTLQPLYLDKTAFIRHESYESPKSNFPGYFSAK